MTFFGCELLLSLLIILAAAEIFTNALEHLGDRLKISEGVTGSLFAAVGTALPETMVPILAMVAGTQSQSVNEEISVGAILGAPLMLGTLTTFLMALAAIKKRGFKGHIRPEKTGFVRDMSFFIVAFSIAALAMLVPHEQIYTRMLFSMLLVLTYIFYIICTFRASQGLVQDGHGTEAGHKLFLTHLRLKECMPVIYMQLLLGLILLVGGAKGFIHGIEDVSNALSVSPLILSLLIIPIAT